MQEKKKRFLWRQTSRERDGEVNTQSVKVSNLQSLAVFFKVTKLYIQTPYLSYLALLMYPVQRKKLAVVSDRYIMSWAERIYEAVLSRMWIQKKNFLHHPLLNLQILHLFQPMLAATFLT